MRYLPGMIALVLGVVLVSCQTTKDETKNEVDTEGWMAAKAEIYRELAMRSLRGGDPERTKRLLAEAVQFEAGDVRSLQLLARLLLASGELVQAKSYARWWVQLEPHSVPALCLNGIIDESLGNLEEAEAAFRQAAIVDAGDPWPMIDLHTFFLNRGKEVEAATVREVTLQRFPDCHEVLLDHGAYLESRGQWTEALAVFQEAREMEPENLDIAVRVGTTALLGGRDDVLVELEQSLPPRARLQDASLALLLSALRLRSGDEDSALRELDLLEGTASTDPTVWLLRGEILLGRQDLAAAEAAFQEALNQDERLARAHAGLARVHLSRGRLDAAVRELRRSVQLEPRNAVGRGLLAGCLARVGDVDSAREHLDAARSAGDAPDLVREIEQRFPELAPPSSETEGPR